MGGGRREERGDTKREELGRRCKQVVVDLSHFFWKLPGFVSGLYNRLSYIVSFFSFTSFFSLGHEDLCAVFLLFNRFYLLY